MLYVVLDRQGAGRVVGVFDSRALAERVLAVNLPYYELFECSVNIINASALGWLPTDAHRTALRTIADENA